MSIVANTEPGLRSSGMQGGSVMRSFSELAQQKGDALAVVAGDRSLTYGELESRSNRVAQRLVRLGVGSGSRVGLYCDRGIDMVVGALGVLKSGAAYVPMDPAYPAERVRFVFGDAGVRIVVGHEARIQTLGDLGVHGVALDADASLGSESADAVEIETGADDLAYVIYTSGSTGNPKGVAIAHADLAHYVDALNDRLGVRSSDRYLHTASMAFSSSVRQLMVPLSQGATLVIATQADIGDPRRLFRLIKSADVSIVDFVPSYWQSCMRALLNLEDAERAELMDNQLRLVLSASEPLPSDLPRRWREELGHGARMINMFGQTETTGIATTFPIEEGSWTDGAIVRVGQPIPGVRIHVVDAQLEPVGTGEVGEVCVAGPTVGRGYIGLDQETAQRFIAEPGTGARMYCTGDRGHVLADGTLEFLGRADNQVKIRGHRVEVEEIEATLRRHPDVHEVVVSAATDPAGEMRLVAYVGGTSNEASSNREALRAFAKRHLPAYMVPSLYVRLEALPRTPNGKLDRRALPAPDFARTGLAEAYVEPTTATESALAAIWSEVMAVPRVGRNDSFVELGGHSLMAIRVASRVRTAMGVTLPLPQLLDDGRLAAVAAWIDGARSKEGVTGAIRIAAGAPGVERPLSFSQERLWVMHRIDPTSAAYNLSAVFRLLGDLNIDALAGALSEITRRHEALRTIFPDADGVPEQIVVPAEPFMLHTRQVAGQSDDSIEHLAAEEAARPFDLERGPLFRGLLLRRDERDHVLVLTMHHIVSDGWSRGVLYRELSALYAAYAQNQPSPLPELPIQFADFTRWQRETFTNDALQAQAEFWKKELAGAPTRLDLPTDRPRPTIQTYNGAIHTFEVPADICRALRELSSEEGATPYMSLLAGFQLLLARYSGQEDVVVGSPTAGRVSAETEPLIGFFVNTLAMRADMSGQPTYRTLLRQVRDRALGAFAHQDLPFERLVELLQPERDLSRSPIFQAMFILQNAPMHALEAPGLRLLPLTVDTGASKFDLTLSLVADGEGYVAHVEYNTDLFDASTIERLGGHYNALLAGAVERPDDSVARLGMLADAERERMLVEWNDTARAVPTDACVHDLFTRQAQATPDHVAVVFEDRQLTYRELDERSNQLANYLRKRGVETESLVAISVERSLEMMVGLLAIQKAGAAYVPLDPAYPADRIALMLEDSGARVLLTQAPLMERVSQASVQAICLDSDWPAISLEPATAPATTVRPSNAAYVIYTSGSTGKPKGVVVEHRNVVNFFVGMDERIGGDAPGTWLAVTSISFDISVLELFWTLTRGYTVIVMGDEGRTQAVAGSRSTSSKHVDFSLFYFASNESENAANKYRLLLEGARFADQHGFEAVWTPERHFHAFGGLYPAPAVASAAIAATTRNVKIRAGSVVLPLHSTIRVAEDWSVVDNLSNGRVGLAFASGWHDRDFVFAPGNYERRRDVMFEQIEELKTLWRGGTTKGVGGTGKEVEVSILPKPVQPELPIWITAAGSPDTFIKAGETGANLLTHLLGQSIEQLAEKVVAYREARRKAGHAGEGRVTLMLHTFIGTDQDAVREKVWQPFREYLKTSVGLIQQLAGERGQDIRAAGFTAEDMEALLDHACERYFNTSALLGTPETCLPLVDQLKNAGVDEIACLVDFGVDTESTLSALEHLGTLKRMSEPAPERSHPEFTVAKHVARHRVTHLQCTPSMASLLLADGETRDALADVGTLMLGGEALPLTLAEEIGRVTSARIVNMYGPTETTIWSSTHPVSDTGVVSLGRPIANTEFYVLDRSLQPVPVGVPGELLIGGAGVVRGYLKRPELTAERFIAHPFRGDGARLYRTGDLVRYRADGTVEFMGRLDHQVKVRGHRIELGEIESLLNAQPMVREGVVVAREDVEGDKRLVAYVTAQPGAAIDTAQVRDALAAKLPDYMVPSHIVVLDAMPLTPNAKIDRKALPAPSEVRSARRAPQLPPENELERVIAGVWQEVLRIPEVGVQDNFFDLGGHSLLTVRVHAKLKAAISQPLSITDLFRFPTIRALAKHLGGSAPEVSVVEESQGRAQARRQAMQRRRPVRPVN